MDLVTKKLIKNGYRITRDRDKTALRVRIPGGVLPARYLDLVRQIAEQYGDGTIHLTTRQGLEIPGIPLAKTDEVNRLIAPLLRGLEREIGVPLDADDRGYPAAGTRNVTACIGSRVCPFANYDTTALAAKVEAAIYPHDFHVKIALSGCPNDCIKGHLHDVGVMGMVEPLYDPARCISCQACVNNCRQVVTGALSLVNYRVVRDGLRCLGCGECVLKCPAGAWTRGKQYYRMVIMGRTGKKNPRLARPFLEWVDEEVVLQVIKNMYAYIDRNIDRSKSKEHVGYIVDRTGYPVFRDSVLAGVTLNNKARVARHIDWGGYRYERSSNMV
ncbi:MAG TPA: sulfite reductase subunit C [Spirochaetia bacterium]|nr:sulfite reductase subunit C [Spirochaetia bacterium]